MSVLPKGRSSTTNLSAKAAVVPKGRSFTANSGTKVAVFLGMNRCGSFLLLSVPHPLFSIWTDLRWIERIPGTPTWGWGEWIWPTGSSKLHRNSTQGLNISFIRGFDLIRDPEIPITLRPRFHHHHHRVFCPRTGLPPQTQEPRLQFYYGRMGAVASRCFPHPLSY